MNKTFLLFMPWLVSGGADRCGLDLCKFFKAQGWRVVVVATREHTNGNSWRHKFDAVCDEVIDLGTAWRTGNCSARIRDVILRLQPRVCCVNNSHEAYSAARMIYELLPACLCTCLLHMELPGAWDFPGQLVLGQHRWFHRILTVSTHLSTLLADRGVPVDKLQAVPWFGFEREPDPAEQRMQRHLVRQQLAINPNQFTVLFPMRLQAQKQPRLLPAIAGVLHAQGGNPCFIVAGDGPESGRVRKAVEQAGLAGNFRFLGATDPGNMPALYAASDVLCLPSLDEGIPLVYFEAMQSGLPIVGSDVGAVAELVTDKHTGILIPKGAHQSADNYAEAIRWIMQHSAETRTMTAQARTVATRQYGYPNWQAACATAFNDAAIPHCSWTLPQPTPVEKVFVIGAPRTGTSSLGEALKILGYRNYGFDAYMHELWTHGNLEPIWELVGQHDSFSDGPFNTGDFYRELAAKYPHAKFILTVRNKQAWKLSHQRHFDPAYENKWVKPRYKMHRYEPEIWWRWYDRRNAQIRAFFQEANRPHHLLEFQTGEERDPWSKLVNFLGSECRIPSPLPDFPHLNKFQA